LLLVASIVLLFLLFCCFVIILVLLFLLFIVSIVSIFLIVSYCFYCFNVCCFLYWFLVVSVASLPFLALFLLLCCLSLKLCDQ
jgi:hypothetical protein